MSDNVVYRPAIATDSAELSDIAFRSKAYWGYSKEFMEACREELTYSADLIEADDSTCIVAEVAGRIAGFVLMVRENDATAEIDGLFMDPDQIGLGIGKALMHRIFDAARESGLKVVVIQADPNAEQFYEAVGAVRCGERESASIPGRMLPLLEVRL